MSAAVVNEIRKHIDECMIKDRYPLRRQLQKLRQNDTVALERLQEKVYLSKNKAKQRQQNLPPITYNQALPIVNYKDEIITAIKRHQVVVIAGETGSGKTTQLPKICLEACQGIYGIIGHTQPRRLAARALASRIAEELRVPLGEQVGYQVRFADQTGDNTLIKLMTDGILLAEIQNDRFLDRYDMLIIDEAHERSLNIDFLLGYIKVILPKRPNLKVIITSATIDVERFSRHFNNAPIISVSGRTYPVELRYRPIDSLGLENVDPDQRIPQSIYAILLELSEIETQENRLGDVLVFFSGERDIRETAKFLRDAGLPNTEILPLYARLTFAEQNKIFQPHSGRRVVLSTNVAETSLTVPGIRYVIDLGTARVSRYSFRSKVQRLPIEHISQASASQRKGRCGRVANGVCFRLYSEEDFQSRAEFTDPEIIRTNLAAVILQMLSMRLGDIAQFPFVDSPENKAINDGFNLLQELGAVDNKRRLTTSGRQLSKLPVDPRIGRMLIDGNKNNALKELLVIVSALAVQDPRERPTDKQQAADQCHRQYYHNDSDFLTFVNMWDAYEDQRQLLSQNKLKKYCKQQFLSFIRMREWRDLHRQLSLACRDLNFIKNDLDASYENVHKSLLAGLLSNLGNKDDEADYMGTRNRRFYIFPTSTLYKRKPKWVMSSELIETSRLFARINAKIEPSWIEPLAYSLVKRNYFEPRWEKKVARVIAFEQITLFGLIIVGRRRVDYSMIDPVVSRELFIRDALVEGYYESKGSFQKKNNALICEINQLEDKSRRRNILIDSQTLYSFYDEQIPNFVVNGAQFEKWYKEREQVNPNCLMLTREYLMRHDAQQITESRYPDCLNWKGLSLPLSYHFVPGDPDDGVTLTVPVQALQLLPTYYFDWLVPGMLFDKMVAMVRALPKALRKNFVPVPDFVNAALETISACDAPLTDMLGRQLTRMTGVLIPESAWLEGVIDIHFKMNFKVIDENNKLLRKGRNLNDLKKTLLQQTENSIRKLPSDNLEKENLVDWCCDELPREVVKKYAGITIKMYPAFVDKKTSVDVKLFENKQLAEREHKAGIVRLLSFKLNSQLKFALSKMPQLAETKLLATNLINHKILENDVKELLLAQVFLDGKDIPTNKESFNQLISQYKGELVPLAEKIDSLLNDIFRDARAVTQRLKEKNIILDRALSMSDIKLHISRLFSPNFIQNAGMEWLSHYPRFIKAVMIRLDKLPKQINTDRALTEELSILQKAYEHKFKINEQHKIANETLKKYRWMLEEYRVSLFAQQLRTRFPVSSKRLKSLWNELQ